MDISPSFNGLLINVWTPFSPIREGFTWLPTTGRQIVINVPLNGPTLDESYTIGAPTPTTVNDSAGDAAARAAAAAAAAAALMGTTPVMPTAVQDSSNKVLSALEKFAQATQKAPPLNRAQRRALKKK
jgi:hypothetical protein